MDSTCLLVSKSYCTPEKARYVHHLRSSMILTWEGTYWPSYGELYDFDLRRKSYISPDDGQYVSSQVKIIELPRWWTVRAFSGQNHRAPQMMDSTCLLRTKSYCSPEFWPEKTRTVHHLGSSMNLTWEDTYCPSFGELYEFDMRRHVMSIIWGALSFWSENTRTVHHLGQYVSSQVKIA
jgi:hypothetical protein